LEVACPQRLGPAQVATPDHDEGPQVALHGGGDRVAGVEVAQVHAVGGDHQPPVPGGAGHVAEAEPQHGPAGWDGVQVNVAVDVPHQQVRVQVLVPEDGHP